MSWKANFARMLLCVCCCWSLLAPSQTMSHAAAAHPSAQSAHPALPGGVVRSYFIAADETEWDYAPDGAAHLAGTPGETYAVKYTEHTPQRIGSKYRKAIYHEYTDASFQTVKQRAADQAYLGILGPILHAQVGDTIRVVFKNNTTHAVSMHPHGVAYDKDSEGTLYGGVPPEQTGVVAPGQTHTYTWEVPERAGPGPSDPNSIVWLYHSHVDEPRDVNAGLIGAIIVTRRGMARADGTPKDVDGEFVALFLAFNENQSLYFAQNIENYVADKKNLNKLDANFSDEFGNFTLTGTGFAEVNLKWSMNGYIFGNMPMITIKKGQHVRWYLLTLADGFNFHTPHWHGNVVTLGHQRTDVVAISPAQMLTVDMVPDRVGMWMFHCHVSDHMMAGMMAHYQVVDSDRGAAPAAGK